MSAEISQRWTGKNNMEKCLLFFFFVAVVVWDDNAYWMHSFDESMEKNAWFDLCTKEFLFVAHIHSRKHSHT